nr:hypothetical protein [Chitinophagaceae bacterium]
RLINKEMKKIGNHDVLELTLERPVPEKTGNNTLTVWIVIDNVYSINIGHTNRSGKADEKLKKAYFDSFRLNKQ